MTQSKNIIQIYIEIITTENNNKIIYRFDQISNNNQNKASFKSNKNTC